jgi:hypothetical protein
MKLPEHNNCINIPSSQTFKIRMNSLYIPDPPNVRSYSSEHDVFTGS